MSAAFRIDVAKDVQRGWIRRRACPCDIGEFLGLPRLAGHRQGPRQIRRKLGAARGQLEGTMQVLQRTPELTPFKRGSARDEVQVGIVRTSGQ